MTKRFVSKTGDGHMRIMSLKVLVLVQVLALLALPQTVTAETPQSFDIASHPHSDENADNHHGDHSIDLQDEADNASSEHRQQTPVDTGNCHPCCTPGFGMCAAIMPEASALPKGRVGLLVRIGRVTALHPVDSLPLQHPPEFAVS
jgi:hypothetical protein